MRRTTWGPAAALLAACAPAVSVPPPERATPAVSVAPPERATPSGAAELPAGACRVAGIWTAGMLRTTRSGTPFAHIHDRDAVASIAIADGPPLVSLQAGGRGWHLVGRADLATDDILRPRARLWLTDGVTLAASTRLRVVAARPGAVRVGPPRAFAEEHGVSFIEPVERWVPCEELAFSFEERDHETARREREELNLPLAGPASVLRASRATLAREPGGPAFLRINGSHPALALLETRGKERRVAFEHGSGMTVLGWTSAPAHDPSPRALRHRSGRRYLFGVPNEVIGSEGIACPGPAMPVTICTSPERLQLWAARSGAPQEPIGWLDPDTPFERMLPEPDGRFSLWPVSAGLQVDASVLWYARARAPLLCERRPQ